MDKNDLPLGKRVGAPTDYDPDILIAIPRQNPSVDVGFRSNRQPNYGTDVWVVHELTWLNATGVPKTAVLEITVPASSPCIVESKSMKLFIGSLAFEKYASVDDVRVVLLRDLANVFGCDIKLTVHNVAGRKENLKDVDIGECIDELPICMDYYRPNVDLLQCDKHQVSARRVFHSHVFRSLCPITSQPDYASIRIAYSGFQIDEAAVLKYLASFRNHQAFHEPTIDRIFHDLFEKCNPTYLSVFGCFTRRGGIDISPFRSTHQEPVPRWRPSRS